MLGFRSPRSSIVAVCCLLIASVYANAHDGPVTMRIHITSPAGAPSYRTTGTYVVLVQAYDSEQGGRLLTTRANWEAASLTQSGDLIIIFDHTSDLLKAFGTTSQPWIQVALRGAPALRRVRATLQGEKIKPVSGDAFEYEASVMPTLVPLSRAREAYVEYYAARTGTRPRRVPVFRASDARDTNQRTDYITFKGAVLAAAKPSGAHPVVMMGIGFGVGAYPVLRAQRIGDQDLVDVGGEPLDLHLTREEDDVITGRGPLNLSRLEMALGFVTDTLKVGTKTDPDTGSDIDVRSRAFFAGIGYRANPYVSVNAGWLISRKPQLAVGVSLDFRALSDIFTHL